jgi:hypothetical protein
MTMMLVLFASMLNAGLGGFDQSHSGGSVGSAPVEIHRVHYPTQVAFRRKP